MYPSAQLKQLALEKDLLERRIAINRARCIIEWDRVRRPIEIADNVVGQLRRLAPLLKLLAIPLGIAAARRQGRSRAPARRGKLGLLLKWAPVLLGVVRSWRTGRRLQRTAPGTAQRRTRSAVP